MLGNKKVVVLMAVANETSSAFVALSNSRKWVGGFKANPMPTVQSTSSVLVKIPVSFNRWSAGTWMATWRTGG